MILRLQASWEINKKSNDRIELFSPLKMKKFQIKSATSWIYPFIKLLSRGITYPADLKDFANNFNIKTTHLEYVLSNFKSLGMLIQENKFPSAPQETIYDRQIRFFRTFEDQSISGEKFNENLQNRTALIVGLGGYGSWTAVLCARMGIQNIIGIDFDVVENTNLHRQILYNLDDLRSLKTKACERKIKETDPKINFTSHNIKISSPDDLIPLLDGVDLVFNPFSYVPLTKAITHPAGIVAYSSLKMKVPCLTYGGSWIGPLTIPDQTPCYFCTVKTLELHANLDPDHKSEHIRKRAFAPPIAACCSLAVNEASRYLSFCDRSQVLNGIIQLDIFSFENSRFMPLHRLSDCSYCSE